MVVQQGTFLLGMRLDIILDLITTAELVIHVVEVDTITVIVIHKQIFVLFLHTVVIQDNVITMLAVDAQGFQDTQTQISHIMGCHLAQQV